MEERLINWIYGIVGSSYVILAAGLLLFAAPAINDENALPVFFKSLGVLIVYTLSLWLLHFAKSKNDITKLKIWSSSLTLHIIIMIYVIYILEDVKLSLIIMIPEIIVLVLMLVGIFIIGRRVNKKGMIQG